VWLKRVVKRILAYQPLAQTDVVRQFLNGPLSKTADLAFTPFHEGDLMYSLIRAGGYKRCLETGFGTGSTALYMLAATGSTEGGHVTSIDCSETSFNETGQHNIRQAGHADRHTFVEARSEVALPSMYLSGENFDFVYIDGWKTFDHLAFELYMLDSMLSRGGAIMFDDAVMPGVRRAIRLLKVYYGYQEVDYVRHNQNWALRLLFALTTRTLWRPYRALIKMVETEQQSRVFDWNFDRPL
jgi:predicted O-methyltransferase YrrM